MENKPKPEEVASALIEHLKDVFSPEETARKIIDRVRKGGSDRSVISEVELMLMEFSVLVIKKKDSVKDVLDKFKTK